MNKAERIAAKHEGKQRKKKNGTPEEAEQLRTADSRRIGREKDKQEVSDESEVEDKLIVFINGGKSVEHSHSTPTGTGRPKKEPLLLELLLL